MKGTRRMAKLSQKDELESVVRRVLRILKAGNAGAGVFLLLGGEMKRLKEKTTGKSARKTPDVLSFVNPEDFPHPEEKGKILGEIYVNSEVARRDPARASFLAIHGLLHLLGYSHSRKSDTLKMEKLESKLMRKLKISNSERFTRN